MKLFNQKTIIVTGAGRGLGRCHALAFASEGAQVVVNDIGGARDGSSTDEGPAAAVVREIIDQGGIAVADTNSVATPEGAEAIIQTAVKAFGRVDVLVNNAGILRDRTLLKMSFDEWQTVNDVHLRGTFLCTQFACRRLKSQGEGGVVINTTSTSGLLGNFGQANYGAAKSGIAGFTRVAAIEMARYGIRVNAVAPLAKTRMTEELEEIPETLAPEHVSPLLLFLASEHAKDVSGRIFAAWGGRLHEFYYTTSEGAVKLDGRWSVDEIAAQWGQITQSQAEVASLDL